MARATIHAFPQPIEFGCSPLSIHPIDPVRWSLNRPATQHGISIPINAASQTAPAPVLPIFDELYSHRRVPFEASGKRYIDRLYPVKKRFTTPLLRSVSGVEPRIFS